jgi:hypothetical protein
MTGRGFIAQKSADYDGNSKSVFTDYALFYSQLS